MDLLVAQVISENLDKIEREGGIEIDEIVDKLMESIHDENGNFLNRVMLSRSEQSILSSNFLMNEKQPSASQNASDGKVL